MIMPRVTATATGESANPPVARSSSSGAPGVAMRRRKGTYAVRGERMKYAVAPASVVLAGPTGGAVGGGAGGATGSTGGAGGGTGGLAGGGTSGGAGGGTGGLAGGGSAGGGGGGSGSCSAPEDPPKPDGIGVGGGNTRRFMGFGGEPVLGH